MSFLYIPVSRGSNGSNTFVGVSALRSITTGENNSAFGIDSSLSLTTGNQNSSFGGASLAGSVDGFGNSAFGFWALKNSISDDANSAFGWFSLATLQGGNSNSSFGYESMAAMQTASGNSVFGYRAARLGLSLSNSCAFGSRAMESANGTTGATVFGFESSRLNVSGNFYASFGYRALQNATGSGNTAIGTYAGRLITTGEKNSILGSFDGNQFGLDIRTLSNYIVLSDGDGNPRLWINNTGAVHIPGGTVFPSGTPNGVLYLNGAGVVTSGTALTFDGTSFGIGTNNPTAKLQVNGNVYLGGGARNIYADNGSGIFFNGLNNFGSGIYSDGSGTALKFQTLSVDRMTIDSSGNLGLGVTPSASVLPSVESEFGILVGRSSINIAHNAYYGSGGWTYIGSTFATQYNQDNGEHRWYTSTDPTPTAGNAISFTQAMTLDASGNLGVGSTAPVAYSGYVGITAQATNGGFVNLRNGTLSHQMEIAIESGGGTGYVKTVTASPLIFGTNNTEKLRLKPEGQLRFFPLAADPAGAEAGDVYYNSGTNKLRLYDGSTWVDLN